MSIINIAIDGPAGAGKSTIAKSIAKDLNITYLDTGAMYRAFAYIALSKGINLDDIEALKEFALILNIEIKYNNGQQSIWVDGNDVSSFIRTAEISKAASIVAQVPEVRLRLVELQREIAKRQSVIMDGRDIGTYVLPKADIKIFLTATIEERARRRFNEMLDKNPAITFTEVLKDIETRDINDSTRAFAPLKKAEDAIEIDTTGLTIKEIVDKIINLSNQKVLKGC